MRTLRLGLGWLVSAFVLGAAPALAQHAPGARPPEVTDSAIAWGRHLFHGSANCASCHGIDAQGTDEGPALTGALWLHGPGTYEWLVEQIKRGIPAHQTWTRKPMPMRGWTNMPDEDVRAVAAYVWSITHPPRELKRRPTRVKSAGWTHVWVKPAVSARGLLAAVRAPAPAPVR